MNKDYRAGVDWTLERLEAFANNQHVDHAVYMHLFALEVKTHLRVQELEEEIASLRISLKKETE